jgi:hypothetical protein
MRALTILCLSFAAIISSCAGGPHYDRAPSTAVEPTVGMRDLVDFLAVQPGVQVRGSGARATIHLSGSDYPNPPLFVIDGISHGYEFSRIYSRVQASDVESVRIIRANDAAAAAYGVRGGNGVVEITMKRGP